MSYSLVVLPAVAENLTEALREREQLETRRALLAEIAAMMTRFSNDHAASQSRMRTCTAH